MLCIPMYELIRSQLTVWGYGQNQMFVKWSFKKNICWSADFGEGSFITQMLELQQAAENGAVPAPPECCGGARRRAFLL